MSNKRNQQIIEIRFRILQAVVGVLLWYCPFVVVNSFSIGKPIRQHYYLASFSKLRAESQQQQQQQSSTSTGGNGGRMLMETSASKYSGAGPVSVDMNQYNLLSIENIATEWTAVVTPATPLQDEGIYLQAKSKATILADTIRVTFPRIPGKGLGLQLLELAGGREDGIGITIVESVIDGGCAAGSGILTGDSIIKVDVVVKKRTSTKSNLMDVSETEEVTSVGTECLGYDKTVEALLSLPPAIEDNANIEESFVVTLKRLRRKPKVSLKFQYPPGQGTDDITLELFAGENLRRAMLVRGVKLNDPLARRFDSGGSGDCGAEGTCATCAVSIVRGQELLNPPGSTERQIFNEKNNPRWRMACKTIVGYGMKEGEIVVRVNPKQWADGR